MSTSTDTTTPDHPPTTADSDKAAAPTKDKAKASEPARRGVSIAAIIVSFLLVAAITVAAGSTWVAMQVIAERNELQEDYIDSTTAVDNIVQGAAEGMKGPIYAKARDAVFAPAIEYYQKVANQPVSPDEPEALPEVVSAQYQLAALQAKTGKGACVQTLATAINNLMLMEQTGFPADRYPSLTAAFQMTAPENWVLVKDSPIEAQATTLIFSTALAGGVLGKLAKQYPETSVFREDQVTVLDASGKLQSQVGSREEFALTNWTQARDVLESLVRDRPGDLKFQTHLADVLESLAALQQKRKLTDEAIASYQRAVEVRQQIVDANPEDKSLADKLAKVKGDLEKLGPAAEKPAEGATPPDENASAAAE